MSLLQNYFLLLQPRHWDYAGCSGGTWLTEPVLWDMVTTLAGRGISLIPIKKKTYSPTVRQSIRKCGARLPIICYSRNWDDWALASLWHNFLLAPVPVSYSGQRKVNSFHLRESELAGTGLPEGAQTAHLLQLWPRSLLCAGAVTAKRTELRLTGSSSIKNLYAHLQFSLNYLSTAEPGNTGTVWENLPI